MANYIGNVPASGEFKRLDSIASSFNGTTTQFNLTYGSVSQTAGDSSQLIVSLNGIIQEPLESYTLGIGGSSIVFSSAPLAGDTCHIVLLGGVGSTTTPTDGSVTAIKLDAALKDYYEDEFVANGAQTTYTLSRASIGVNQLMVTIDGIVQPTSAYSAVGTTLTISPALPNGTNVRVVHMGVKAGFYVPPAGSVGLNEVDLTAFDNRYYQGGDNISVGTIDASSASISGDLGVGISAANKLDVYQSTVGIGAGRIAHVNGNQINVQPSYNYYHAYNHIFGSLNGTTTHLTIDNSGRVGIGDSNPNAPLLVKVGTNANFAVQNTGGALQLQGINDAKNAFTSIDIAGSVITFSPQASEAVRINSNKQLFVGTTSTPYSGATNPGIYINGVTNNQPDLASLFVSGNKIGFAGIPSLIQNQLTVYDSTAGNSAGTGGGISFGGNAGNGQATFYAAIEARKDNNTAGDYGASLNLYTRPSGGTYSTPQIKIHSNGAVTTPNQPHWFGTNNNTYTTDSTTWITHGSGNNGGVNTGILKFPNVYSSSGSEWNGQRYTATVAGLYHWELTLDILNPAGIVFRGAKNGVRFHDEERVANISGGGWWNYNYSGYVYLNSGDYWEFQLTNGTWSNIAGGVWSKMAIRLVG